jgi:hypothetical protein
VRHLVPLSALLLLAVAIQWVAVCRSVVPGLDAGRFLITAEWMDREGMLETIRSQTEQPLYSVWVWVVRDAILATVGSFPALGAATVQLAAAVPLVVIVVPVYFISLRLYGQASAVAGTLLFCLLPRVVRLGPDGISDSLHLLLFAIALWIVLAMLGRGAMAGFHRESDDVAWELGRRWWMLGAGLATGLAVLTRAESFMLPAALAVGGIAMAVVPACRRFLPRAIGGIACFVAALLLVLVPFLGMTGSLAPRAAMARLLGRPGPARLSSPAPVLAAEARHGLLERGEPLCFAPKEATTSRHRGFGGALKMFGRGLSEAYWYWVGVLGVGGLWIARRLRASLADCFVRIFVAVFSVGVLFFGACEGYLAARHLLPLVVVGIGCCGFGAVETGLAVARWSRARALPIRLGPAFSVAAVLALAGGACLPQALRPVGRSAEAHRAACDWLAAEPARGTVIDTRGWSRLYSGRKTYQYADGAAAFADPGVSFVVVEPWELQGDSPRSRTLCRLLAAAGQIGAEFAGPAGESSRGVMVYRWRPERLRPGATAMTTDAQRVPDARTSASLCPERR